MFIVVRVAGKVKANNARSNVIQSHWCTGAIYKSAWPDKTRSQYMLHVIYLTFRLSGIKGPQTLRKEAKSSKFRVSKTKGSLLV